MLVTSQFVVLNLPKTGSSFVRKVLKTIYARRRWQWRADRFLKELMLPRRAAHIGGVDQHGTFQQIPDAYKHLPAVSVVRNPYEKLLSAYEFTWWKQYPPVPAGRLAEALPSFPDLSLDEFVRMWDLATAHRLGGSNPLELGHQTVQFVNFFFRDPLRVLASLSDDYIESGRWRDDMAEVTFLRQERLADELAELLARFGFSEKEQAICRSHAKVNVTTGGVSDRMSLWTPTAGGYVQRNERYLLQMLNQLGIEYAAPQVAGVSSR